MGPARMQDIVPSGAKGAEEEVTSSFDVTLSSVTSAAPTNRETRKGPAAALVYGRRSPGKRARRQNLPRLAASNSPFNSNTAAPVAKNSSRLFDAGASSPSPAVAFVFYRPNPTNRSYVSISPVTVAPSASTKPSTGQRTSCRSGG